MARFTIHIKSSAQKELDALEIRLFQRIDAKILALADNPRPPGCKKLQGSRDLWRIRVGDYRVVYRIEETATKALTIVRIAHRREAYES